MPTIALLTDFGQQDYYVGAMKGAILTACPGVTLVDLLHEIPAHDILGGALALEAAHGVFPEGTVFVAVVDPGVGSQRRPIAARAGRWLFAAPDNGLLSLVLEAYPDARIHCISNPSLSRAPVSAVFHGRDIFGPVAARLACGMRVDEVGPLVTDPVQLEMPPKVRHPGAWEGCLLRVDRFGNFTTNLRETDLLSLMGGIERLEVWLGGLAIPFVHTYSDVPEGQPCALIGSGGRLEIAVNRGRADRLQEARGGAPVMVRLPTGEGGGRRSRP